MAHGSGDEGAVGGHLGHAGRDVVPVFAAVVGEPAGDDFLEGGEGAGREHFSPEGVALKLFEVGLGGSVVVRIDGGVEGGFYSEIT